MIDHVIDAENELITITLDCVDRIGADFVANVYQNLVNQFSPFIFTISAIYIGILFIRAMRGVTSFDETIMLSFRLVAILTLVMNYHYFCLFFYNIFTKEPLIIVQAITVTHDGNIGTISINQGLDDYLNVGLKQVNDLYMMSSWTNPFYLFMAGIVFAAVCISAIYATGLIIIAKCSSTLLLALSPLFFTCAIFDATRGYFEAFVRNLVTYFLIPILVSAILMILFSVQNYLYQVDAKYHAISFPAVVVYVFMAGIQIYFLQHVYCKASSLGGGFALKSVTNSLRQAAQNIMKCLPGVNIAAIGSQTTKMSILPRRYNQPKN